MKTITFLLLMLVLLCSRDAYAQGEIRTSAPPEFTNCFLQGTKQRAGGTGQPAGRPQSGLSSYGGAVTPRGTLKVLVIFAGFTNDVNRQAPDYFQNSNNTNPWPQTDATHPVPGTSFPRNANVDFYNEPNSFQNNAVDKSLSNLYYQMSRHSANPFKLQAVFFPKRINVTADNVKNARSGGMFDYTDEVMAALVNDPDTQNFDFSQVDQRGAGPNFQYDNSSSAPDHVIDYTVIVWRNPGTPFGTQVPQGGIAYGGAGWASVPPVTGIPSANGQVYSTQFNMGFTQAAGMTGLDQAVFVHEFAHNVFNAPHYLGANRTVGENFYISEGPGLMGNFRMFFMANAWERWYNGWVELVTGATHVNSDVQGPASLTATNGEFTLRDYITTGDVMRIRLPNSSQYLWLENHQYQSGFDGRSIYLFGNQQPTPNPLRAAPVGIVAMVEGVADSRSTILDQNLMGCNGLKVVSAQGNFDYTLGANLGSYNNYFWHNGSLNDDLYNFTNPVANPFGGESQITRRRIDLNGNNEILTNRHGGNVLTNNAQEVTESTKSFILNSNNEDGIFGPDAAFNTVGQKMGNSYNPAIFEQQYYDITNARLSSIKLGGLSVELIAKNAAGDITVKVRYDDVNVVQNTRWSGDLQMTDVPRAPMAPTWW